MELLAVNLDLVGILVVSTVGTIGILLVSYAIAGWYERRARRRRLAPARPMTAYGGFWIRFVAYLIDGIILGVPFSMIQLAVAPRTLFFNPSTMSFQSPQVTPALLGLALLWIAVTWLYHALLESGTKQATLGKSVVRLKVSALDGSRISFPRATVRYFSKIINGFTFLIGYFMIGWTSHKQGLHDMLANTLVYKKEALPEASIPAQDRTASQDKKGQGGTSTPSSAESPRVT